MEKKIGWGSLSIPLFILAILVSVNLSRTLCLGDVFLRTFGLNKYSLFHNMGVHNTLIISLILFIDGFILGQFFNKSEGALLGRNLCLIFGAALCIVIIGYFFQVDLFYPFRFYNRS